jgi:hypothetical protein
VTGSTSPSALHRSARPEHRRSGPGPSNEKRVWRARRPN